MTLNDAEHMYDKKRGELLKQFHRGGITEEQYVAAIKLAAKKAYTAYVYEDEYESRPRRRYSDYGEE